MRHTWEEAFITSTFPNFPKDFEYCLAYIFMVYTAIVKSKPYPYYQFSILNSDFSYQVHWSFLESSLFCFLLPGRPMTYRVSIYMESSFHCSYNRKVIIISWMINCDNVADSLRVLQHVETIQVPRSLESLELKTWKDITWETKVLEVWISDSLTESLKLYSYF